MIRWMMRIAALAAVTGIAVTASGQAVAAPPAAADSFVVESGRLSGQLNGVPLAEVLRLLAGAVPLTVIARGPLPETPVTATLAGVDLEAAVKRLLRGHAYLLVYVEEGVPSGPPLQRLAEIVILPASQPDPPVPVAARPAAPVPAAPAADARAAAAKPSPELAALAHAALWGASAEERADAIEAVAYEGAAGTPGDSVPVVLTAALSDPDEGVRARALEALKDTVDAEALPLAELAWMAIEDGSPARRIQALELLAERAETEAAGPLRQALADPEAEVRERARELLTDLHLPHEPAAGAL
jgi:hypothetical protein